MKDDNQILTEISKNLHELTMLLASVCLGGYDDTSEITSSLSGAVELLTQAELIVDGAVVHSTSYLLLKANGECSRVEIPYDKFNERLHELIGCEYYELVSFKDDFYFAVDELGKCYKNPKPVNKKASLFYPGMLAGDFIVGDIIIGKHGYVNGEPYMVGLTEDELKYFENFFEVIK